MHQDTWHVLSTQLQLQSTSRREAGAPLASGQRIAKRRHPNASEQELLLQLAAVRLGPDLTFRAYGWRASDDA